MKINTLVKQLFVFLFAGISLNVIAQPVVSSFSPVYGAAGSSVTITGTGFDGTSSNNVVYFGNCKASVTSASTTSLTVTVPSGATYQPIRVVNLATSKIGESADKFILSYAGTSTAITSAKFNALSISSSTTPSISGLNTSSSSDRHNSAAGDLNGDGKPEIIISEYANAKLDVFVNGSSSGSLAISNFSSKQQFTTLTSPSEVDLVDINNDGLLDVLVSAPASSKLSIFINTTTSSTVSFATRQDLTVASTFTFYRAFDANNDGKLDIAGFAKSGSTFYVYPNTSTFPGSTISLGTAATVSSLSGMVDMDCGDINNDGKIDVALAKNSTAVSILLNTTSSGSLGFSTITLTASGSVFAVKIADLNRDGNNEILCGLTSNTGFNIFQNNFTSGTMTSSSFASPLSLANMNPGVASSRIKTWAIDVADLDGDGAADIISGLYNSNSTPTGYVMVAKNSNSMGSGTTLSASNFTVNSNIGNASFGKFANVMAVDLDGDGKIDILSNSDTKLYLVNNVMAKTALLTDVTAGGAVVATGKTYDITWNSSTTGAITKTFTIKLADITSAENLSIIQSSASTNWKASVTKAGTSSAFTSLTTSKTASGALCYSIGANTTSLTVDVKYDNTTSGTYITNVTFQLAGSGCSNVSGDAYIFRCTCIVVANVVKSSSGGTLSTQVTSTTGSSAATFNVDANDTATIKVDANSNVKKMTVVGGTTLTLTAKTGGATISVDSSFEIENGAELKVSGEDTVSFEMKKGAKAYIRGIFKAESSDGVKEPKVVFKGEGEVHFENDFDVDEKSTVKFTHTDKKHIYFDGDNQNITGAGKIEFDEHCHVHFGDGTATSSAYQRCTTSRETKFYGKVTIDKYTELISDAPPAGAVDSAWQNWSPKVKLKNDGTNQGSLAPLSAGSTITGGVQWEMYNSAVRSYRTVAFPLKNPMNLSQITDNLVVSGSYTGTNRDSINNSCSYCLPSAYYWDEPTSSWVAYVGSSTANKVPVGQGILLFFRGMKSYGQGLGDPNAAADPGVIDIKGEIFTGSLTKSLSYASSNSTLKGYNLVGNPYPANIDFNNLTLNKVANQFAVFDPLAKNYNVWYKSGNSITRTGTAAFRTGPERLSSVIEAGASFFAIATGTGATITFDETDKTDSVPNTTAFREVQKALPCNNLKIALEYADTTKRPYMDQNFMEWDSRESAAKLDFDELDMHKIYGGYIGIGTLTSTNEWLGIDRRPFTQSQIQSLPLKIKTYEKVAHVFKYETCPAGADTLYKVKLVDKVLHKEFDIKDSGVYKFTVSATDTFKENRFDIVVERLFDPQFADVNDPKKELKENMPMGKYAIYPIPVTNGVMNVAGGEDNDIKEVIMTDLQGQVVLKLNSEKNTIGSRISLPNSVKSGIYMVQIKGIKGEINQKVLINN